MPRAYDLAVWAAFLGHASEWRRRAVRALRLGRGDRVLDLASGHGVNFEPLEAAVGSTGTIVALDRSEEMLAVARARSSRAGWRNIRFIAGDVTVEPDLEEFDGVLCTLGLSAMKDHRAAITAVGGALKGGGRLAVLDAGRYRGLAAALNPFLRLSYRYAVGADVDKDIVGAIEREFGAVQEERFFGGSAFIAVATR